MNIPDKWAVRLIDGPLEGLYVDWDLAGTGTYLVSRPGGMVVWRYVETTRLEARFAGVVGGVACRPRSRP